MTASPPSPGPATRGAQSLRSIVLWAGWQETLSKAKKQTAKPEKKLTVAQAIAGRCGFCG